MFWKLHAHREPLQGATGAGLGLVGTFGGQRVPGSEPEGV